MRKGAFKASSLSGSAGRVSLPDLPSTRKKKMLMNIKNYDSEIHNTTVDHGNPQ
jgi:hypothetical protein